MSGYEKLNLVKGDHWGAKHVKHIEAGIERLYEAVDNTATDERFFDIDYDGIVSLKPEYRGHPTTSEITSYSYSESDMGADKDGSLIDELPEKIIFPEVICGTAVTGFQPGMFMHNPRITEIVLPSVVSKLPDYFCRYAMNLRSVHNTEHVTELGKVVFGYTRIEKALFPNLQKVTTASLGACEFLYIADIGNNLTELPTQFLAYNYMLSAVKGGEKVTKIGPKAFYQTRNLKNLSFLSNVTSMGDNAFYLSRVQFDWSTLNGKCTFGKFSTPIIDNTEDYWSDVSYTACENRLVTLMSQVDKEWKDEYCGTTGLTYEYCCSVFSTLHIHSAITGKNYSHPDEFVSELKAIDDSLLSKEKIPSKFANQVELFNSLGYKTTTYTSAITTEVYQAVFDALARGAYVCVEVSTSISENNGHVVVLYGINSIGETLIADSAYAHQKYQEYGIEKALFLYRMPMQNTTGPNSKIIIIEKAA